MKQPGIYIILFSLAIFVASAHSDSCKPLPGESDICRDTAIWEQPCPCPSGIPLSFARYLEGAIVKIVPYGYAKWEGYWDTRHTIGTREEEVLFFPQPITRDPRGIDIFDRGKWHMTCIESRFGVGLTGPVWCDITSEGRLEVDFRGPSESGNSTIRLRHAFGLVSWGSGSFLFGQWWHPLFIVDCFPHTVAFSIGAPMEFQAREPQLRLTQKWHDFEFIVCLASEREFASNGPQGISTEYIRNSVIPNIHLQARWNFGKNLMGIAGDYKRLVPRIQNNFGFSVREHIDSFVVEGFAAFTHPPWSARFKGFWGENANAHLFLSGFAVETVDPITDTRTYSATAGVGGWADFSYIFGCDDRELGLFVGGLKNVGSRHRLFIEPSTNRPLIFSLTAVGQDVDYVVRVAPRFVMKNDPIRFGAELEWTRAAFGTPNVFGRIRDGVPVDNYRILLVLYYMF